jgi:hypothetical protein
MSGAGWAEAAASEVRRLAGRLAPGNPGPGGPTG